MFTDSAPEIPNEQFEQEDHDEIRNVDDENLSDDSDATISDTENEVQNVDSDDEIFLMDNQLQPKWISGQLSSSSLSDFEKNFLRMFVSGKFTEVQGGLVLSLIEKCFTKVPRKTRALMNFVANSSFGHYFYAQCNMCKNLATKVGSEFLCERCHALFVLSDLETYVAFNLEDQIRMLADQVPGRFVGSSDSSRLLVLRLIVTCDGIPLSKSSNLSLYPVTVYIENIEHLNLRNKCYFVASMVMVRKKRISANDTEIVKYKPCLLLQPFLDQVNQIKAKRFETKWSIDTKTEIVAFVADAPCRAEFLEVIQYNGNHPCHRCHIIRENGFIPICKHDDLRLKTKDLVIQYANATLELNQNRQLNSRGNPIKVNPVNGVKPFTLLNSFEFDFIKKTPVEIMHCLFLGFVKRFLKVHVIDNLGELSKEEIDRRVLALKLPSSSKRNLRTLCEFANFKSSEFEMIFFYYGQFLLKGILSDRNYNLLMFLSSAIFKLWSKRASFSDCLLARGEIDCFMEVFKETNQDTRLQTYNLHCFLHLFEDRETFGPLSKLNAYCYENQLQSFKNAFSSKNKRLASLVKKVKYEKVLPIEI